MDAFLRRVIEQRDLEQEAAILATPVEAFIRYCRVCERRIGGDSSFEIRVCTECGGAKRHSKLVELDAARAARQRQHAHLLQLAGLQPQPQEHLMTMDRNCTKCGKKLRSNNNGDDCWSCRQSSATAAPADGGGQPVARKPKAGKDVVKRFRVVANALGCDADDLIVAFCEGWLEKVKSSVDFGQQG